MGLALDEPSGDEVPVQVNGLDVLIEEKVKSMADKSTVDYVSAPDGGGGFTIISNGASC